MLEALFTGPVLAGQHQDPELLTLLNLLRTSELVSTRNLEGSFGF